MLERIEIGRRDGRGFPAKTPPPEMVSHAKIREAIEAYARASDDATAAAHDLTELTQQRPLAEETDKKAYADALAKNARAADPGTPATDAHDAKIAEARRRAEALGEVAQRKLTRVQAVVDECQQDWHDAIVADMEPARQKVRDLLGELAAAVGALERLRAAERYASGRAGFISCPEDPVPAADAGRGIERERLSVGLALGILERVAALPQESVTMFATVG